MKEWLDFVLFKIANIEDTELGSDRASKLISASRDALRTIAKIREADGKFISRLDTSKEEFALEEGIYATKLLEIFSGLFGHFSLLLLFMHMWDFYIDAGVIRLDICGISGTNLVRQYLNDFQISNNIRLGTRQGYGQYFALFFADSFMTFPGCDSIRFNFGYSPLPFLDSKFKARNYKDFGEKTENFFYDKWYDHLYENYHSLDPVQSRIELFIDSGRELFKVIQVAIDDHIDILERQGEFGSADEKEELRMKLIENAEKEIFMLSDYRLKLSYGKVDNIRFQAENYLIGYTGVDYALAGYGRQRADQEAITFYRVEHKNNPVKIPIDRSMFADKEILIFRDTTIGDETIRARDLNLEEVNGVAVSNRLSDILSLLKNEGGLFKIYPVVNLGEIKGINFGFQYVDSRFNWLLPSRGDGDAKNEIIDLQNNQDQAVRILEKLIKISLGYQYSPQCSFSFLVRSLTSNSAIDSIPIWEYNKALCWFDRNRVSSSSVLSFSPHEKDGYHKINFIDFEISGDLFHWGNNYIYYSLYHNIDYINF